MPEIGVMIQQKVRKKKIPVLMLIFISQSKIINNKGVYSSNKMRSLKNLAKFKCESRTSLHAVQYK